MRTERQNNLIAFVHISHFPQKRKYTGEPYSVHLRNVADMADKYGITLCFEIGLCHDLFEDTKVTKSELNEYLLRIGYSEVETNHIVNGVIDLTDVYTSEAYPNLNRAKRKYLECERLSKINATSQSVKYCDLIDNTSSIVKHDAGFAKVYLQEKFSLLKVMTKGNKYLYKKALSLCK